MATEYLDYYRANRRPRSAERHEMALRALTPLFAGKRLADINPFLIEKYKRLRKETGRSEVTINRELAFLKNMFTMAIKWGKATDNPVSQVKFFREDNGRTRFLTEDEEACLLTECGPHLRPIVIAALHTGFRKSELLSPTWDSVNFRQRIITVEAAYALRLAPEHRRAAIRVLDRQGGKSPINFPNRASHGKNDEPLSA